MSIIPEQLRKPQPGKPATRPGMSQGPRMKPANPGVHLIPIARSLDSKPSRWPNAAAAPVRDDDCILFIKKLKI